MVNSETLLNIIVAVGSILGTVLTIMFIKTSVRCFSNNNDNISLTFFDRMRKRSTESRNSLDSPTLPV